MGVGLANKTMCRLIFIFLISRIQCGGKLAYFEIKNVVQLDIVTHPISQNVSLNSTATFTCVASDAAIIVFYVNTITAANPSISSKGFDLLTETTVNNTVTRSLTATAFVGNNNTNISCEAFPSSPNSESNTALLLIQGIIYLVNC